MLLLSGFSIALLGAIHLLAVIVILGVGAAALLGLYWVYRKLFQKLDISADSDWKVRPPTPVLSGSVRITYAVTMSYTQRGVRKVDPYAGAEVTFSLSRGDASVDGSMTKKVTTDAQGEASVLLAPVRNGTDTLSLHLKAGLKEGDEQPIHFETVHH